MIDTIVLTLNRHMYHISQPERFTPSASWVLNERHKARATQSRQNPTKAELRQGIYKPRLTISNRINALGARDIMLKIELSLPKLLLGNNFEVLQHKGFTPLAHKLQRTGRTFRWSSLSETFRLLASNHQAFANSLP